MWLAAFLCSLEWNSPQHYMSEPWRGRLRSSSSATTMDSTTMDDDTYRLRLVEAFKDEQVIRQLQLALKPLFDPLQQSIQQLTDLNAHLRQEIAKRDQTISCLTQELEAQKIKFDDLEQHGRKGSIRIFGLPEETSGTVDEKVLELCNDHMKVRPKLVLEDIEVAHRLGKPPPQPEPSEEAATTKGDAASATQVRPRPIIVKLASRRTKQDWWRPARTSGTTRYNTLMELMPKYRSPMIWQKDART